MRLMICFSHELKTYLEAKRNQTVTMVIQWGKAKEKKGLEKQVQKIKMASYEEALLIIDYHIKSPRPPMGSDDVNWGGGILIPRY